MKKVCLFFICALSMGVLMTSCSDDDPTPTPNPTTVTISGLDFNISADQSTPNVVSVTPSATNATSYSVDFGDPNSSSDVFTTTGSAVTYTYPEETASYTISVTASADNATDVSATKNYNVTVSNTANNDNAMIAGTWVMAPSAGALSVGPARGSAEWWSLPAAEVATRACYFDDLYIFGDDGSFQNVLGDATWVETWQGAAQEGCAPAVAPHDGTASATYSFQMADGTLMLSGKGAFVGLAKTYNGGELTSPDAAVDNITYYATLSDDDNGMKVEIEIAGGGWWTFNLIREGSGGGMSGGGMSGGCADADGVVGTWRVTPEAGALKVGPSRGSSEWWSLPAEEIENRGCFLDDDYIFGADGSFQNVLGDVTWIETWQGVAEDLCEAPVAPHDGTAAATYTYDEAAGTVLISGRGAFLGLAKVVNGSELTSPADAPDEVTYQVSLSEDKCTMTVEINFGGGWWTYSLTRQ